MGMSRSSGGVEGGWNTTKEAARIERDGGMGGTGGGSTNTQGKRKENKVSQLLGPVLLLRAEGQRARVWQNNCRGHSERQYELMSL